MCNKYDKSAISSARTNYYYSLILWKMPVPDFDRLTEVFWQHLHLLVSKPWLARFIFVILSGSDKSDEPLKIFLNNIKNQDLILLWSANRFKITMLSIIHL